MQVATWKVVTILFLLIYGFFGIIHADAAKDAAWGNFLNNSGIIALVVVFCLGVYWFFSDKGTRTR